MINNIINILFKLIDKNIDSRIVAFISCLFLLLSSILCVFQYYENRRYEKLIKISKKKIVELTTMEKESNLKTFKELSSKIIDVNELKLKNIDNLIHKKEKKRKSIIDKTGKLSAESLLEEFKKEGF